jgi:N-methylhydantoinase B
LVRRDVVAGYVTREGAERDYGVVFGDGLEIDAEATARHREEMEKASS